MQLPEPAVLFTDDFRDPGFAARWEVIETATRHGPAQWSVRRGILRQTSNCYTPNSHRGTILLARAEPALPYRIRTRVRSKDDDRFGLAFGYIDSKTHYLFWTSAHRTRRTISQIYRGRERALVTESQGYLLDRWYDLDLMVTATHVRLFIDGIPAVDVPLSSPPIGRVGLYCHANEGLEVDVFTTEQAIGESRSPTRLQWRVQDALQTVIAFSNVTPQPVWIKVDAWNDGGEEVQPSIFQGFVSEPTNRWRRLEPLRSATAVFGPPQTGHGHCAITWRTHEPADAQPILVSAWISDGQGRSWSPPVHG